MQHHRLRTPLRFQGIKLFRVPLEEAETGGHQVVEDFYRTNLGGTRLCGFRYIWETLEPLPLFEKGVEVGGRDLNHRLWTPEAFQALHDMVDETEVRMGVLGSCIATHFQPDEQFPVPMTRTGSD